MSLRDKRSAWRVPLQISINEHVGEQTQRGLSFNVGANGLYLNRLLPAGLPPLLPHGRNRQPIGLEFELPHTSEVIWAAGEICHESQDDFFRASGVRFTGMADYHRRLIDDYVNEFHTGRLHDMLATIRRNRAN